jgi:hypothetical protein
MMTAPALHPILAAEQAAKAKGPKHYAQWRRKMGTILHEACHCVVLIGHTTDDHHVTTFGKRKGGGGYMQNGFLENPLLDADVCLAGVAYEELILDTVGLTDEDDRARHLSYFAGSDMEQADDYLKEWAHWVEIGYNPNRQKLTPDSRADSLARLSNYLWQKWYAVEYAAEYMMRNWKPRHLPKSAWSKKVRKVINDDAYRRLHAGWANPIPPKGLIGRLARSY